VELTLKGIVQVFGEWVQEVSCEDDSPEGWFRRVDSHSEEWMLCRADSSELYSDIKIPPTAVKYIIYKQRSC
jgi:hypothetical protein